MCPFPVIKKNTLDIASLPVTCNDVRAGLSMTSTSDQRLTIIQYVLDGPNQDLTFTILRFIRI